MAKAKNPPKRNKKPAKSKPSALSLGEDSQTIQAMFLKLHRLWQEQWRDPNPYRRFKTSAELAKLINRSRSTFFRLLAHLQDDHRMPVDVIPERGGYGYTEEVTNFPAIQFTQAELIAIFAALNSLRSIRGNPFNDDAQSAFDKLSLALDGQLSIDLAALESVVCFRSGGHPAPVKAEFIETAVRAAIDHEELVLHHCKPPRDGEKPRTKIYRVRPYFLLCAGEVWYLYTWDHDAQDIRRFALARVQKMEKTGRHFALPPDYDREKILGTGFGSGLFGDDDPQDVRIQFNATLSPLIKERIWHPSQKIDSPTNTITNPRGSIVLNLRVSLDHELANWIRGWGKGATVLGPDKLRDAVEEK